MADFVDKLRDLDRVDPPDVWSEIEDLVARTPNWSAPSLGRRAVVLVVALALAGGGLVFLERAFRGASPKPGHSLAPAAAMGNGVVVFGCGYHICSVDPDGTGLTDLIEPYDRDLVLAAYSPVVSPDGSRIAFRGYPKSDGNGGGGANYDIYVMGADGSGLVNLTGPNDPQFQGYARWSPNGSMIAYEGDDGTYVMNADGSDQRKLVDGAYPAWSPDGAWIAFVMGGDHRADLWKIHPDGTGLTQLTQSSGWDEFPMWSPDGSRIAFLRDQVIHVVNADGTGVAPLADIEGGYPFQPQWSPDGTKLAFEVEMPATADAEADGERNYDIFTVNVDGSELVDLTPTTDATENYPIWSPDGSRIAFGASQILSGENAGTFDLYTMKPDGTGIKRLTTDAGLGVEFDISWQPVAIIEETPADSSPSPSPPAPLTRGTARYDAQEGVWMLTPPDWSFLKQPSGPLEPRTLFAIANYPVERGGDCAPTAALEAAPSDGALAWVTEYRDAQGNEFPIRPERFSLDPASLANYECSGAHPIYLFRFQDAGRFFQVHVGFGEEASDEARNEILASLSSLVVDRCPPADVHMPLVSDYGELSSGDGTAGEQLSLSGPTGRGENAFWAPLAKIEVWWSKDRMGVPGEIADQLLLASVDPKQDCTFSASFSVPDVPTGDYLITVLGYWDPSYPGASGVGLMGERTFTVVG